SHCLFCKDVAAQVLLRFGYCWTVGVGATAFHGACLVSGDRQLLICCWKHQHGTQKSAAVYSGSTYLAVQVIRGFRLHDRLVGGTERGEHLLEAVAGPFGEYTLADILSCCDDDPAA